MYKEMINDHDICIELTQTGFCKQAVDYPQRRYRIVLRSTMGPIDVYLVR